MVIAQDRDDGHIMTATEARGDLLDPVVAALFSCAHDVSVVSILCDDSSSVLHNGIVGVAFKLLPSVHTPYRAATEWLLAPPEVLVASCSAR